MSTASLQSSSPSADVPLQNLPQPNPNPVSDKASLEAQHGPTDTPNHNQQPDFYPISVADVEAKDKRYKPLNFKPPILQRRSLFCCLTFFTAVLGAIITVTVVASRRDDSFYPDNTVQARTIQFTPGVLGSITNMLWTTILTEYRRLSPFFRIKDRDRNDASGENSLEHSTPWAVQLANILVIFIVPLKSIFIWVDDLDGLWVVTPYPLMGIVLAVVYLFLTITNIWIIRITFDEHTGLQDDPVSIADQLWLCERMNIAEAFNNTDRPGKEDDFLKKNFRIGYWEVQGAQTCSVVRYGIRVVGDREDPPGSSNRRTRIASDLPEELITEIYQAVRFSRVPFWASPVVLLISSMLSLAVFALLNVALGINGWTDEDNLISINADNAWFQLISSLFGSILLVVDQNVDTFYRAVQPYVGMYTEGPAEENLFLDYPNQLPVLVTITALKRKHYKVALASAVALLSQIYPIVLGGMYLGIPPRRSSSKSGSKGLPNGAIVLRSQPVFWIVYAFTFLHTVHPLVVLPWTRKRYLPGSPFSVSDTLRYCYASSLITEGTKVDTVDLDREDDPTDKRKHYKARLLLRKGSYRFGIYDVRGRGHIGFDVADRMRKGVDNPKVSFFTRKVLNPQNIEP